MTKQEKPVDTKVNTRGLFIDTITIVRHALQQDDVEVTSLDIEEFGTREHEELIIECLNNGFQVLDGLDSFAHHKDCEGEHYSLTLKTMPRY